MRRGIMGMGDTRHHLRNAMRFYGLGRGRQTHGRLIFYYRRHGLDKTEVRRMARLLQMGHA